MDATNQARPTGFGPDFRWGVATAAYQIEGAVSEDGRGPSVWDTFCAEPGRIKDGDTGAVACDHYHRWPEDLDLIAGLGVGDYRFSVAWPRIQPTGSGPANPAGLDFYDRLVDALLERGISPVPTLFHWDTPQALQDAGGWQSRETAARFGEYAGILGERLADRVTRWATLNEPTVVTLYGHGIGIHAPGLALGFEALPVAHHLLLGHGRAVAALRAAGVREVGIVNNHAPTWPRTDSANDGEAAALFDDLVNWTFSDPVLLGRYPESIAGLMPQEHLAEDLAEIAAPLDWFGLNHYFPSVIGAAEPGAELPFAMDLAQAPSYTGFGWPVLPAAFTEILLTLKQRYGDALPPITVTENGCAFPDVPGDDGVVHDTDRIAYLDGYLRALLDARDQGVDVGGYYCWSLMDNFEWAEGYSQRFGLVHVDFTTLQRTPKDSYRWFADVVAGPR